MKKPAEMLIAKERYISKFTDFENKLNGQSESFLKDVRKESLKKLESINFPTLKDEEWRYTNLLPILKRDFIPAMLVEQPKLTPDDIKKYFFQGFDYNLMVFVNGIYSGELSDCCNLPEGVITGSLSKLVKQNPEIIKKYLNTHFKINNAFDALNSVYLHDGVVVIVPDGQIVEKPLQILFINGSDDELVLSQARNIFIAGENSQLKIIMNFYGYNDKPYFTNIVNEVILNNNSVVDIYKNQHENTNSFHIDKTEVYQHAKSIFNHYSLSFGGALVRNDLNSKLDDENSECHYYGLYLAKGKQHIDNHTFVDHAKPNCFSNELYKGILEDDSHGVFNGKIMVRQDAQKTNAFQSNKTILLSEQATIDTKPQLEIYADDVKCSHGATVGSIDDQAYFYIRSRGIPSEIAKSMLIRAFANDVIESVKIDELKEQLNHMIFEHLNRVKI